MKRVIVGILVFVSAAAQGNAPPRLGTPNDIAGALYKCGAIDGNIGMARLLAQAPDVPNKDSWDRAIQRLENDRTAAHCEQYMRTYNVERGYWRFTP